MIRSLALVAVGLMPALAFAAEPSDWPQWRGPNRENKSSFTGISKDWNAAPPKLKWKLSGLGEGYASVAVVGDRLYTTGNLATGQTVFAVDLKSQSVIWSTPITSGKPKHGYEGSRCTPTVDGNRLYAVSSDGGIACLNAADGAVVWKRSFSDWKGKMMSGWGFSESPLVDGEHVVCTPGGPEAMVVCLKKSDGEEVWKCAIPDQDGPGKPGAGYSSIVISQAVGVKQYVTLVGRGVVGIKADDGKHLWSYTRVANTVANIPTVIPSGDYIFSSSGYDTGGSALIRLTKSPSGVSAEEVYYLNNRELQNHHGGMVLLGDVLYFGNGHNKGFPVAVDLPTGKILWNAQSESRDIGSGSAAITFVDGHLIFRYQSGSVALIEATPSEFRFKGKFTPAIVEKEGWSQPVVVNGQLFLREQSHLMVYDVTGK